MWIFREIRAIPPTQFSAMSAAVWDAGLVVKKVGFPKTTPTEDGARAKHATCRFRQTK